MLHCQTLHTFMLIVLENSISYCTLGHDGIALGGMGAEQKYPEKNNI